MRGIVGPLFVGLHLQPQKKVKIAHDMLQGERVWRRRGEKRHGRRPQARRKHFLQGYPLPEGETL